ncbi:uncharacterized protein [Choristoneura fumiferana]|uniref:uncharacterized protein n=1 Tax=Choristoneura fumiferana TaxID=7141 RepID=UPI003D15E9FA
MPMSTRAHAGRPDGEQFQSCTDDEDAGEDVRAAGEVHGARTARAADRARAMHATPETQPSPPPFFNAEQFVASFMHTFAQSQAEMNRSLIENLRSTAATPNSRASEPAAAVAPPGNFSTCTARFDGRAQDPEVLEAFLDAVEMYKECTAVSDEHAVRGLAMLLEGDAAVWWRGVRNSVTTWRDAATRLRAVYGAPRPAYQLLREIFAAEQQTERAETFICKIRALIVKLPYVVPESMQIDMIYGLLHRRVRKRLPRDSIESVDSLLSKARSTEDSITESAIRSSATIASNSGSEKSPSANLSSAGGLIPNAPDKSKRNRVQCSSCKVYGHVAEACRNLNGANRVSAPISNKVNAPIENRVNAPVTDDINTSAADRVNAPIRCYGCGKQGVIRSRCETCNSDKNVDFYYNDDIHCTPHPTLMVSIFGQVGVAIMDTGATHCVASPSLYAILVSNNVSFQNAQRTLRLADGTQQTRDVLTAEVPITIEGRNFSAHFMVLPGDDTRTLLGFEFLSKAGIVLDGSRDSWSFADTPERSFAFVRKYRLNNANEAELMRIESSSLALCYVDESKFSQGQKDSDEFLGHVTIPRSIHVPPDGTAAIAGMSTPQNAKHLKRFLQASSRFRRFIPNYAEVVRPLTILLKKASTWSWGMKQREAFERVKSRLVSTPTLRQADATKPFVLRTNSSRYSLRAVLIQGEGPDERPVEYASRLLSDAEKNYSTAERETLAAVWAVSKFRNHIKGARVIIMTDDQPLRWLTSMRSPSNRLARWASTLQEFNLHVNCTPERSDDAIADTPSRPVPIESVNCDLGLTTIDVSLRQGVNRHEKRPKVSEVRRMIGDSEPDDPFRGRPRSNYSHTGEPVGHPTPAMYGFEIVEAGTHSVEYTVSHLAPLMDQTEAPVRRKRRRRRPRRNVNEA